MIEDKKFDEKLLGAIKEQKIKPRPKWAFTLKNFSIWLAGFLSLILGSVAISLIFYMVRFDEFDIYRQAGNGFLKIMFLSLPIFWMIFLAIFIVFVYLNIKNTKKGYRYPTIRIIIYSLSASLFLGIIFANLGLGKTVDGILGRRAPYYDRFINPHVRMWNEADKGRLGGLVVALESQRSFTLVDLKQKEWNVQADRAERKFDSLVEVGKPIRLIGRKISDDIFEANIIIPFRSGGEFFDRLPPPPGQKFAPKKEGKENVPISEKNLSILFEKYPSLKESFVNDLLQNKDRIKKEAENDQRFVERLKSLNISQEIIDKIFSD